MASISSIRIWVTAQFRYRLRLAGITYHGAAAVEHLPMAAEQAF